MYAALCAAALMGNKQQVWAFDRDASRLKRLQSNVKLTGATNIIAQQASPTAKNLVPPYTCMLTPAGIRSVMGQVRLGRLLH